MLGTCCLRNLQPQRFQFILSLHHFLLVAVSFCGEAHDLSLRRISLSLKQANEGVDPDGTEFDPALYGMLTEYDEAGNYKYPDGFDPETNEWRDGFETQREKWEQDYAAAQARWESHKKQVAAAALEEDQPSSGVPAGASSFSSDDSAVTSVGTLADDESLAALREKLSTGN